MDLHLYDTIRHDTTRHDNGKGDPKEQKEHIYIYIIYMGQT
jgi:hypothetical protein